MEKVKVKKVSRSISKKAISSRPETMPMDEIVKSIVSQGLDWEVGKIALVGILAAEGGEAGQLIQSDSFEMYRKDNLRALGTVGKEYQAIQNDELAKILVAAVKNTIPDNEINRYTGGLDMGGRVVYMAAVLDSIKVGSFNISRSISVINSHDGTIAVNFGMHHHFKGIGAMRQKVSARFRHSGTVRERVQQAVEIIKKSYQAERELIEQYNMMNIIPIVDDEYLKGFAKFFFAMNTTRAADLSTKRMNQVAQWKNCWEDCANKYGRTVFALFLSAILYTDKYKADKHKTVSVMTGKSYDMNLRAYTFIQSAFNLKSKNS